MTDADEHRTDPTNPGHLLCPSYVCKPGAHLFGIVSGEGRVTYLQESIEIDETFAQEAYAGRAPDKRFRFAGKCARSGCKQWDGSHAQCGLIDTVIEIFGNEPSEASLPICSIRPKCRWYSQRGAEACANCTEVIRRVETARVEEAA